MRRNLIAVMDDRDVTQRQLAKAIHVTPPVISQYAHGVHTPPLERAFEIARHLQVPGDQVEWLFQNYD